MESQQATQVVLASRPATARASLENFRVETTPLPVPGAGQVLLRVDTLSLDPYMRGRMNDARSYAKPAGIGEPMPGESVATVLESHSAEFVPGDVVLAQTGWRSHVAMDAAGLKKLDVDGIEASAYLGVLGMPGFTAWSGLEVIGKPKAGETLVVGAATGPVGSLVGQLAKLAGLRAVGIAGGPKKCAYLIDVLGFDAAIDHRSPNFAQELEAACPNGIDVYFENIGGAVWNAVLPLLNQYARVPVCGLMVQQSGTLQHDTSADYLAATMRAVLTRSLQIRGYINYEFTEQYFDSFLREVGTFLREGKIKHLEDVTVGLENAPQALLNMIDGRNFGKVLVQVRSNASASRS
ncbi:NADP-dependent oxidoreductase [Paraburkholderia phytofirmans OLGA172]|uniref:NADP-dependent oxidoreductase n=1 Tax=Paraburkholderia phytofirmans OLGA172 TaxID=1417228 RepID=A0A160FWC6_9BURK|nr:NADP-dependent oxidoreductase [Paraburkholderia phytofirmans]ANB77512.1 NADP-dependent oxidoreductase [Paraburkholderia phytofirmans OLGA172]